MAVSVSPQQSEDQSPSHESAQPRRHIGLIAVAVTGLVVVLTLFMLPGERKVVVSDIESDERIDFLPTYASYDAEKKVWRVRIHAWVFEPEFRSLKRRALKAAVRKAVDVPDDSKASRLFDNRADRFLVDNESGKTVVIRMGPSKHTLPETDSHGQARTTRSVTTEKMKRLYHQTRNGDPFVTFLAVLPEGDRRRFTGRVTIIGPEGLSVISDIDDTIKMTNVSNRKELLANTFYRPFRPVPDMPRLYAGLRKQGAVFHYVSGSPWQLHEPLTEFLQKFDFPDGVLHLRPFRLRDVKSLDQLTIAYMKNAAIETLLSDFPKRHFLLFGDSGERDPEIYGDIARKYPKQIRGIFIRNVTKEKATSERFRKAFLDIDGKRWRVFKEPKDIASDVERLLKP